MCSRAACSNASALRVKPTKSIVIKFRAVAGALTDDAATYTLQERDTERQVRLRAQEPVTVLWVAVASAGRSGTLPDALSPIAAADRCTNQCNSSLDIWYSTG